MAKGPEIPKTDSAEIEILIERLKQNKLERRDRTTLMHGDGLGQSPATEEYVDKAAARSDLRSVHGKAEDGQCQPAGR